MMLVVPVAELLLRPTLSTGIENAPILVQHFGLVLAMFGAIVAERGGHLVALGSSFANAAHPWVRQGTQWLAHAGSGLVCGTLAFTSGQFVATEFAFPQVVAYGIPAWLFQATMPLGFTWLGVAIAARTCRATLAGLAMGLAFTGLGAFLAFQLGDQELPFWLPMAGLLALLACGAPIFAVLGGLALALFWSEGQPLAAVPLSHYQITVNPSLPALPLFTLAGLVFARTGAAARLADLFTALFGEGAVGTVIAVAVLCSIFTAFTGGSGVTILALGGLLLPLLVRTGYPERLGISLVTSSSALGVLIAPSVPLIMYAILARVPINAMFLAGLVPAVIMVVALLWIGGYLRVANARAERHRPDLGHIRSAASKARWEIAAPLVAIGSLVSGLATPTESAALTTAYALLTQSIAHREIDGRKLVECLVECAQVIGGIMLILGMALGLTNYLVDAGIPDQAVDWVQAALPDRVAFLIALNLFLLLAGALMEIYVAITVLVPMLLPIALSYGIDPIHFGVIFLANIEMGFLCPPAGMNIYFASAMYGKPVRFIAASVARAVLAMLIGTLIISFLPAVATALPRAMGFM
ncbi:MAG: TRAP transporter large permease subunit [Rhodocyclaceae bacterium]|nr:TRAP transporter large permease subunit [Rhodocyclaceae bacterium]